MGVILILILVVVVLCWLVGCRAKKGTTTQREEEEVNFVSVILLPLFIQLVGVLLAINWAIGPQ